MKLFLLNAPRYLAYYIALLEKSNEKGILIITDNFNLLDSYRETLLNLDNPPFIKTIILSEKYFKVKNFYQKIKYRRFALNCIKDVFKQHAINEIITSNDGPLLHQYALWLNRDGKNTYLEDGMFNYLLGNKKHSWYGRYIRFPFNNWLYKKIYFKEWLPNLGVGNNPYTDKVYLTYPNYSAYNLNKPLYKLPINHFLHQSQFVVDMLKKFNLSKISLMNIDYIILLDYHGKKQQKQQKKYQEKLFNICQKLNKLDLNVALKTHPRDFANYDKIKRLNNVIFLPAIVFELFLPIISNKTIIMGGFSTSIMLANTLSDFKVKTIISTNFSNNNQAKILFEKLGIDNISNLNKIEDLING